MKLSLYTGHTLLMLMYLASQPHRLVTIGELARAQRISHNQLMKIVPALKKSGFLDVVRGRCGGVRLNRDAREIRVDEVIRLTERCLCDFEHRHHAVLGERMFQALNTAAAAALSALSAYTLADLVPLRGLEKDGITSR